MERQVFVICSQGYHFQGLFYGVVSLVWLLQANSASTIPSISLQQVQITDWPDIRIRCFYGGGSYYTTQVAIHGMFGLHFLQEEWIEQLALYKYNMWTRY